MNGKALMILLINLRCSDQELKNGCVVHVDVEVWEKEKFLESSQIFDV